MSLRVSGPSRFRASLVIPTKNGGELFRRVVERLRAQSCWNEIEFIVIDSGSTDDTTAISRSAAAIVHMIPPAKFNHGATRDYGISLTSCENVILMVQDAVLSNAGLFARLLSALSEEGIGGVYARQIPQPLRHACHWPVALIQRRYPRQAFRRQHNHICCL